MKKTQDQEVVIRISNPSEGPTCKYPDICDRTRVCETFRRRSNGCGKGNVVYTWPTDHIK